MLVLQRKAGESICIGPDIEIVVLNVSGGRARLGFRCPVDVPIRRRELAKRNHPRHAKSPTAPTAAQAIN